MRRRSFSRAVSALTVALALGSCTQDGGTIYAGIETEVRTVDNSLPNEVTVGDIARSAANTYYVAVGALYEGVLSGTVTWANEKAIIPVGSLVNTLAYDGSTLWGGFTTGSGAQGLYKSSPVGASFTQETDPIVTGKQVTALSGFTGTGSLFAVCATLSGSSWQYELDYHAGTAWTANLISGLTDPIVGVAVDGLGNYYTAAGTSVYKGGTTAGSYSVSTTLASGDTATGIFGSPTGTVFVTTKTVTTSKGGVYYTTNNGTTWTQVPAPSVNSVTANLLSIAGPVDPTASPTANDTYIVGSDGFGYFSLSLSRATFTQFTDSTVAFMTANGQTVPLYTTSVRRVLTDGSTVFLGTNGAGLWRASFDPATGSLSGTWTHE